MPCQFVIRHGASCGFMRHAMRRIPANHIREPLITVVIIRAPRKIPIVYAIRTESAVTKAVFRGAIRILPRP